MTGDLPLRQWLGIGGRDPGCEAAFAVFDEYVDAVLRGDADLRQRFADLITHAENCDACREDTEGLIAALRQVAPPPEGSPPT